jgi:zinc protease
MNRKLRLVATVCTLLFACVCPSYPQAAPAAPTAPSKDDPLPSVDEIAYKCAKGSGGKEAWAKLSTQTLTGTVEIAAAGLTGKIEIFSKAPNKTLNTFSMAEGQFVQKRGYDGKVGWEFDSRQGLRRLEGAELEDVKLEGVFDSEVRLKEVYPDMKVTGRAKVGDRDAYTVVTHAHGGKTDTFYFDAKTGLRIAEDTEGPDKSGNVEKTSVLFEDYRAVDGIQVPFRLRITAPTFGFVVTVQEVKHNVPLDDSIFVMPPENPPAPAAH